MFVLIRKISRKSILKTIKTVYYTLLVYLIYQHAFIVPYLNIDFDVTMVSECDPLKTLFSLYYISILLRLLQKSKTPSPLPSPTRGEGR